MQNWGRVDPRSGFRSAASCSPERGVAVRDSKSVTRPAPRAAIVGVLATFVSFALIPCGVAAAVVTNFETFTIGTVDGQGGLPLAAQPWKSARPWGDPGVGVLPTDSMTSRLCPINLSFRPRRLRSECSRCVCRTHVRRVSSPTRRIPAGFYHQPARSGTIRCSPPSSRSSPGRPILSRRDSS